MDFLTIPLAALILALLCYLLEFCFREGQILHFWIRHIERLPEALYKPLGGCVICYCFWLSVISFWFLPVSHGIFAYLAYIAISHFLIRKLADVE